MPLVLPGSKVPTPELISMFREFVEELEEERKLLASPPAKVVEPELLPAAQELLECLLMSLQGLDPERLPHEELRRWVNLQYEASRVAIIHLKTFTQMSKVPRRRA